MRALTLWQPWASLVAMGAKRWETRGWGTQYRGPLLIHAAQRKPPRSSYSADPRKPVELRSDLVLEMVEALGVSEFETLPRGAVVAVAELVACEHLVTTEQVHELLYQTYGMGVGLAGREVLFGNWDLGRWVWKLDRVRPITPPVPAAGGQRLWKPSPGLAMVAGLADPPKGY